MNKLNLIKELSFYFGTGFGLSYLIFKMKINIILCISFFIISWVFWMIEGYVEMKRVEEEEALND